MRNNFCLSETQAARKKKIRSACAIVETAFSQNNNSAPNEHTSPIRSDPIRSPSRSGIRSDPESDPESDPDFVNGHYQKAFQSAMSACFADKQITWPLIKNASLSPNQGEVKAVKFWYSPTGRFKKLMANLRISSTLRSKISTIRGGFGGRGFNSLVHSV